MTELLDALRSAVEGLLGRPPNLVELILVPMVPVFAASFLIEWIVHRLRFGTWSAGPGERFFGRETVANIGLGLGYFAANALFALLFLTATFEWFWEHRLFTVPVNGWTLLAAFFVQEFFYWVYHWAAHKVRWFWAQHVSHHTGEVMNLSTAARQSVLNHVVGIWIFHVPPVLLGFTPDLILGLLGANLAYQWFVHTESVPRLHPWIEWVFNTPSNHRVHHGRNARYIDKNYGGVIMLFDHLFGTYEPETERVVYGIPRQIKSHRFWVLNLHEFVDMWRDVFAPGPWKLRLQHFWRAPGWERPGHEAIHTWTVER